MRQTQASVDLPLHQLSRLRAFAAVGRNLSFKRAAEDLHVTQSALSHHVRLLEQELGVQLVTRLHRRIELTASGAQLLAACTEGFGTLSAALQRFQAPQDGPLTLSVAPYFSARWLTPRLGAFWARHPDIDLQLRHAYQPADFLHESVDAGINWGHGRWPDADATLVLGGELTVVCSPQTLRTLPRKPTPASLLACRLLYEFDAGHWPQWFANAGVAVKRKLKTVQIDDSHALRRSVLDGHGVALFFRGLIKEDLEHGLLCEPFSVTVDPGSAYYLLTPKGKPVGRKLQRFRDWLLREVAANPYA
jgi:DNA-binding transcriptional LysR family regulator